LRTEEEDEHWVFKFASDERWGTELLNFIDHGFLLIHWIIGHVIEHQQLASMLSVDREPLLDPIMAASSARPGMQRHPHHA
jgi:hypothetical protein